MRFFRSRQAPPAVPVQPCATPVPVLPAPPGPGPARRPVSPAPAGMPGMPDTDTSVLAVTARRYAAVTVHLRGDCGRLADLGTHLPDDWAVVSARHAPVGPADLLVLCAADAAAVRDARAAYPGVVVVAVVGD